MTCQDNAKQLIFHGHGYTKESVKSGKYGLQLIYAVTPYLQILKGKLHFNLLSQNGIFTRYDTFNTTPGILLKRLQAQVSDSLIFFLSSYFKGGYLDFSHPVTELNKYIHH